MTTLIDDRTRRIMRIPYALRHVPTEEMVTLADLPKSSQAGDIALARLEKIGKNSRLELASGRPAALHEGDIFAVVFGNRYATNQFEGFARANGDACDMLSMGGLCGLVASKHATLSEPSKLRLLGAIGDAAGKPLRLSDFRIESARSLRKPKVTVVCGASMDSGKTHTVMSLIVGLRKDGRNVASIKLTGTAAGRDTWTMRDAGAVPALDFVDGGHASTYLCSLSQLMELSSLLRAEAAAQGADQIIIEIADGLLQQETAALLQCPEFVGGVDNWIFACGESMAAVAGVSILRKWGIEPAAISGLITQGPLGMREATMATSVPCFTAKELQRGELNTLLTAGALSRATETASCFMEEKAA